MLRFLADERLPTLVYVDGIDLDVQRQFACPTLRFEARRLDLNQAAPACDLAITNANHGTTAALLMAGKPLLQIPLVPEQSMTARTVRRLGAGLDASPKQPEMIVERLRRRLAGGEFRQAAEGPAARFAGFDADRQRTAMWDAAERLLRAGAAAPPPRPPSAMTTAGLAAD